MIAAAIEASVFFQLVGILVLASIIGLISVKLKQPLIVAFIMTGLLVGPDALNLVGEQDKETVETLAQFGIALLLFMVGLKLDLGIIKQTGAVALLVGIVQVAVTFLLGFLICMALGLAPVEAGFVGLALAFSSTIIAVKLLSDRRSIDSLYGRIALGILILQDLLVILATIVIAAITGATEGQDFQNLDYMAVFLKAFMLIAATVLFIRYAAKPITHMLARNTELMVIFCISFAVLVAAISEYLNFSKELGGLIAGIALASTPYNNVIAARLTTLRDFMLLFFFAHLGAHIHLDGILDNLFTALVLSVFVLVLKPVIITVIMAALHFRKRTGLLTGITLSQISEFSLVLAAMGLGAGLLDEEILKLVTLVGLITMALSTYGIVYSGQIYIFLEKHFTYFRRSDKKYREEREQSDLQHQYDVLVFGLGRYGEVMARLFREQGYNVLGVDFDPDVIRKAQHDGIAAVYGDAADPEFAAHLPLQHAKIVVFSFHHYMTGPLITDLRRTLANVLRENGYKGHIAATTHHPEHDKDLPKHGIDVVLDPFEGAAFHATEQMVDILKREA